MRLNLLRQALKVFAFLLVLFAGAATSHGQNILTEGFEGTTFPPAGWTTYAVHGSPYYLWRRCTGSCGYPSMTAGPHSGSADAQIYNYADNATTTIALATPALPLQNYSNGFAMVSLWLYRWHSTNQAGGVGYATYAVNGWDNDKLSIYVNTAQNLNGSPTYLGVLSEYTTPGSFFSPTLTVANAGWYKYSFPIPASYNGAPAYVIFQDSSNYGWDMYIDDVSVQWISPCTGMPLNPYLITPALSSPLCSGYSTTIVAADTNVAANLYNYWQQSTTGAPGSWVNIPNSSSATFTTPALTGSMYYRYADSCGVSGLVAYSPTYAVPVNIYSIPYTENFSSTLNTQIPVCFTEDITSSGQSRWQVNTVFHDALGAAYPYVISEDDVQGNYQSGKNAFFTLPALPLNAGATYRIRFGYERGRSDANTTNVGNTYPENLFLYENYAVQPSTSGTGVPGGTNAVSLFNNTITVDGHNTASLTFTPSASGAYFFSWYSNTPHPAGGINVAGGLIAVDSIKIDSIGCLLPTITFQPQGTTVCVNNTATITVGAAGYGLTYQWYKNNSLITGATSNTLTIANAQTADAGNYKVIVTGSCGGTTSVQSNTVVLGVSTYPADSVATATPTTFCIGDTAVIASYTSTGNSYQWKLNGNFIPNAFGSTYPATTSGVYQSVVTNTYGCATTSLPVPVTVLSGAAITVSPSGPTTFCHGGSVTLTANNTPGVHYNWLMNNASLSPADTTNVLTTSTAGTYAVVETVYGSGSNNTCTDTFHTPFNVVVNGPTAAPAINAAGPLGFCIGGFVTLSTPNVGQPGYTYQWYQNNNIIPGATSTSYTASASGAYTVDVIQNNCALSSTVDSVVVDAPPTAIASNGTIICSGNTIVLTAPSGSGLSYQWYNNGTPISGQTGQTFSTTTGGAFQVQIMDQFPPSGCQATSSVVNVTVGAPPSAVVLATGPTTFCPGDSVSIRTNYDTSLNYIWNVSPTGIPGTYTALPSGNGTLNGHHDSVRTFYTSGYYTVTESNGPCQNTSSPIHVTVVSLPTPTVISSGSDSLCPGGSVSLSTQIGSGYTYQWIKDGVNVPGAVTPTFVVGSNNIAGNSSVVSVIATNSTGCVGVAPQTTLYLFQYPPDTITSLGPDTICSGTSVTLEASAGAGYSYQWKYNNSAIPGATQQTYSAQQAGTYIVSVVSVEGCIASSANPTSVYVLPVPPTAVSANGSTTFCTGDSVILSAATGSGFIYQWQKMDTGIYNIPGANSPNFVDMASGHYRVVISNGPCVVPSLTTQVTVNTPPSISITAAGPTTICAGQHVTLNASTVAGANYQWKVNNNNINLNGTSTTYLATQSGSYTVEATTNNCVSTSAPQSVTVHPLPQDTITLSTIPGNRNPTCLGTAAILEDKNSSPGFSYFWRIYGAFIPFAVNPTLHAFDSGVYSFIVTDTNHCTNTSVNAYKVSLFAVPDPVVSATGSVLSTGTFVTYQWILNGVDIPGATSNSYVATQSGKYSVRVTDGNGCTATSGQVNISGVGINNINNQIEVKIFPNPATAIVHIEAPVKVNATISSLDGKKILQGMNITQIDLSGLADGIYMITVFDENNNILKIDKLVKTNW